MGIGTRIKQLRKQAGITQPELAEKVGVHETTIRRWEQEKDRGPDNKSVGLIAKALNVLPETLFSDVDDVVQDMDIENQLVFRDANREIKLPNTPETRELFERLVSKAMLSRDVVPA